MLYELIKEYPGSPKAGTIIQILPEKDWQPGYYGWSTGECHVKKEDVLYKEFWQKVKELDYEILSFIWPDNSISTNKVQVNNLIECPDIDARIHSVKRLSDGEVFTLNDKITCQNSHCNTPSAITKIELNKEGNIVLFTHAFYKNGINMHKANHKKILFTTEDGVDMFEGDKYWYSTNNFEINWFVANIQSAKNKNYTYFSTKEVAQAYIDENKPKYSERELLKFADYFKVNYLITTPAKEALQIWKFKK